jgi:hypothetical protein
MARKEPEPLMHPSGVPITYERPEPPEAVEETVTANAAEVSVVIEDTGDEPDSGDVLPSPPLHDG